MSYEYTDEQKAILKKLDEFVQSQPSQKQASQIIGMSDATISQLRKGTYVGNVDKKLKELADYFEVKDKAKLTYTEVEYADTSISSQIYDIISVCQIKGGLAVAAGDAGIGKTKAARKFIADNPSNSFLVTINPCLTNVKSLLRTIADRIGAVQEKSVNELWLSIVRKLSDGTVLIFDEAQHLTVKTIEVLRSFSDYFNDRGQTLGICFIGNIETVSRIGGKKAEFAQIANRTKQKKTYRNTDIQRDDIKKLFPILDNENMNAEIDFLLQIARTPQALRGAINLFSNAYDNENYTYAGLVAMAKFMGLQA